MKALLKITIILAFSGILFGSFALAAPPNGGYSGDATRIKYMYPWNSKDGAAYEYKDQNHNYRIWKPSVSSRLGGGWFVSVKIDHIRSWKRDDHAVCKLYFSARKELTQSQCEISLSGKADFTVKVSGSEAIAGFLPEAAVVAQITETVSKLATDITNKFAHESGGRMYFPSVIEHTVNKIGSAVLGRSMASGYVFRDKNYCNGDVVGEWTNAGSWLEKNDANSLELYNLPAGSIIRVYDDSDRNIYKDSWADIEVIRPIYYACVRSFERSFNDGLIKVSYHDRDSDLDDEVSSFRIIR